MSAKGKVKYVGTIVLFFLVGLVAAPMVVVGLPFVAAWFAACEYDGEGKMKY